MTSPVPGRTLHLNAFLMAVGHHEAAWRHPYTQPERSFDAAHYIELARTAERGTFDSIFFADGLAVWNDPRYNVGAQLEPITLLSAIAVATRHIGLIATVSTTYHHPYAVARAFASLDHISQGRAGWNIVTSASDAEARNFGLDRQISHRERYERAAEFVDVTLGLWDGWADGHLVADKAAGVISDGDLVRALDHTGPHFSVAGPLNVWRSPQGRPLLVQAGSSEDGKEFAARYAEAVFTASQTLAEGLDFTHDLKSRLAGYGRVNADLVVLPGISPVLGGTEEEARQRRAELDGLTNPQYGLNQLAGLIGVPLEESDLDAELPPSLPDRSPGEGNQSRYDLVVGLARRERLTVRELLVRLAGGRGHRVVHGTPEQIADDIERWFLSGAADGFNVMPPTLPGSLDDFVDHVVPLLRARGLFREAYEESTLRGHYGLAGRDAAVPRELVTA